RLAVGRREGGDAHGRGAPRAPRIGDLSTAARGAPPDCGGERDQPEGPISIENWRRVRDSNPRWRFCRSSMLIFVFSLGSSIPWYTTLGTLGTVRSSATKGIKPSESEDR